MKLITEYFLLTDINDICNNRVFVAEVQEGVNLRLALSAAIRESLDYEEEVPTFNEVPYLKDEVLRAHGIYAFYEVDDTSADCTDEVD